MKQSWKLGETRVELGCEPGDAPSHFTVTATGVGAGGHGSGGTGVVESFGCELLEAGAGGWVKLRIEGVTHRARVVRSGDRLLVACRGEAWTLEPVRRGGRSGGDASDGRIEAPMPGALLQVLVEDGATVAEGDDLIVVEAMKMEHRIRAPFAGVVRGLTAKAGERVAPGEPILVLEPLAPGA